MDEVLVPIFATVLSLSIPIVAIIAVFVAAIKKKNRETELRKAIVESNLSPESIKLLVEEPEKKRSDKFTTLRSSCAFIGVGLGALVNYLLGLQYKGAIEAWLIIVCGMGVGMLVGFIVEYKLTQKEKAETTPEE